ncbi:arginine--tRNA ligase [Candidatus Pelagibacter sp. Uisw_099_02]|uniref:arginine--tRNA ligase n=1 Tax=Candidatus Pelagibacter sp. Uisw_099_02 TaxID=3230981 RepID=UPI0039E935E4
MNIFDLYLDKIIILIKKLNKDGSLEIPKSLKGINVDIPPSNFDCDISTNVAMVLSKVNKKSPIDIANTLIDLIKCEDEQIETISVAKPGFINIKFKAIYWNNFIKDINKNYKNFGVNIKEQKKRYLVEFVSANPTGPLHVGHCRGAILGDVISNILIFNKHDVSKEYYVNDYGNQIINFTKSVFYRIREILNNEKFPVDNPDLYPGDYLVDIAKHIIDNNKNLKFNQFEDVSKELTLLGVAESLKLIKTNLANLGIVHDKFTSETQIVLNKEVEKVIENLKEKKLVYEGKIKAPQGEDGDNWVEREQLLFKSTDFGDDKDRALQKSDKSWTYFASDVAYHNNKLNRGFDVLINILGADHAGYIKRITSVVEALSSGKRKLVCKVSQLVKLIKDGKPFKMSKRKGDYITVEDLILEVGKDATRFIMLNRSSDVELDFDFAKVKEKSKDNPLYYVQYCFARISSVFRHVDLNINKDLDINEYNFDYSNDEIKILKKIAEWPKCIEAASLRLEPHRIPVYLYELSSEFHSYWNMGKDDPSKRFINDQKKIPNDKLVFLKVISNVIRSGMNIVGVDTPEKM